MRQGKESVLNMNAQLVFNEFAKMAQSNEDYYTWGKPSQVGIIEDALAYFGLNYTMEHHSRSMHLKNLEILKNFLVYHASDEQLNWIHEIAVGGKNISQMSQDNNSSGKVFVSMPMSKEKCSCVDDIRDGMRRGIETSGNVPYFLDLDAHNGNITLKMLDEIRACKFLVADFTTHNVGVYYEAGYAAALGKTTIHTCSRSDFSGLHFDIKQIQTLSWSSADELASVLREHIIKSNLGGKKICAHG